MQAAITILAGKSGRTYNTVSYGESVPGARPGDLSLARQLRGRGDGDGPFPAAPYATVESVTAAGARRNWTGGRRRSSCGTRPGRRDCRGPFPPRVSVASGNRLILHGALPRMVAVGLTRIKNPSAVAAP